jgi:single-stranded DNA-binding protein
MKPALTLTGNLVRDPMIQYTTEGVAITHIDVASGESDVHTVFAMGELAENITLSLASGDKVMVHGVLQQRSVMVKDTTRVVLCEVEAIEVGVALSLATAEPKRYQR